MMIAGLLWLLPLGIFAHDYYITQPWAETKWKAGTTVKIEWRLYQEVGPEANGLNIDLMDGDDDNANLLSVVAANIPVQSTSFEWTIPKTVKSSKEVFIRITGLGEIANSRFSHRFEITDGESGEVEVQPVVTQVDVSGLVRSLPTVSKGNNFPKVVSIIDPDAEIFTSTVTIVAPTGNVKNRDRLAMSGAGSAVTASYILVTLAMVLLAL